MSPAASSTALVSPTHLSESPVSPTSSEDAASPSAETPSVKPRRRTVRPRPRPLSDYVQLVSRKHPIPEEAAELNHEERTADTLSQKGCSDFENESSPKSYSMSGGAQIQRRMSVAGAVDLFPADAQLKEEHLPPVSITHLPNKLWVFTLLRDHNIRIASFFISVVTIPLNNTRENYPMFIHHIKFIFCYK